ncbi:LpqN/LpqT family lipoprotein [Mycolicibacterium sediminis]|uniref:Lipoprotein LpqN n=1 Tax=Mycolicibacterium sediminis TaxID=1286180 RepID=A0A7I7QZA0_9MYCO|nr:LpqN/LpqT family lipoprotein [Mycolicibacterium sediminis]BBY31658.1 hypothetical protein MSEDJ_57540 [Mycolicibacterium sediminis]
MNIPTKAGGTALAVVALALALTGCGSDSKTEATSSSSSSSSSSASSEAETTSEAPVAAPGVPGMTLAEYVKTAGITETPVKRGDPGTPTIDLPIPAGWEDLGARAPEFAWGGIIFTGDPAAAEDPPTIIAIMSKLTGNVDPSKIIQYAPGELKALPEFEGSDGSPSTLGSFEAFQIGGTWVREGVKRMVAQKTVVIPSGPDVYVLQLNADGLEAQMGPLMDATSEIDEKTVITP